MTKPRLYTASNLVHAVRWKHYRHRWGETIEFTSRWIDMVHEEEEATSHDFMRFWLTDKADVLRSDFLLLYGEREEKLRGALVEAGMALGHGIPVLIIGDHPDYGTWKYHPLVTTLSSVTDLHQHLTGKRAP